MPMVAVFAESKVFNLNLDNNFIARSKGCAIGWL
jgi:hypothetical protein